MNIYLATNNSHKKHEMEQICSDFTILTPSDKNIVFDPEETGSTFMENSLIKAKTLWEIVKQPVIADDSGICVDCLDGRPGIFSARYSGLKQNIDGHKLSSTEQNTLLIEEVNETLKKQNKDILDNNNRTCRYTCAIVFYYGLDRFLCAQETLEGVLLTDITKSQGINGFGYDPIVFLPEYNKTVAQISEAEKNLISHRAKATKSVISAIKDIIF